MSDLPKMTVDDLIQLSFDIKARIQAHAEKHGISFEEAAKRVKMNIDGKMENPFKSNEGDSNES